MKLNKRKIVVYVAGKFTDVDAKSIRKHTRLALKTSAKLWDMGYTVICPHGNIGLEMEKYLKKTNYEDIMKGDFELISRCDVLFLLPNWKDSKGSTRERAYAMKHMMPIVYDIDNMSIVTKLLEERYEDG